MPSMRGTGTRFDFQPLTADRWADLERLFGERGACGGCWCMWWRLPRKVFDAQRGESNRRAFRRLVMKGPPPGVLAYCGDEPVGWCAVSPRADVPTLDRSRSFKPIDDRPVWSIFCLFIARPFRKRGVATRLVRAALDFVRQQGGDCVEAYPVEPRSGRLPDAFAWTGPITIFRALGFREVARPSATRAVMRRQLRPLRRS